MMVNIVRKLKDYKYGITTNFRIMWRTVSGKIGIVSAIIFVILGIFALVAYYPDDARNYESGKIMWRYVNTPNAPPCWAVSPKFDNRIELGLQDLSFTSNVSLQEERSELTGRLLGYIISYQANYQLQLDLSDMATFPGEGLLLLHLSAVNPPGIELAKPLKVVVTLERPDGSTVVMYNTTVQTGSEVTIFGSVLGNETGTETPVIISSIPPDDPKYKALFDSLYQLYPKEIVDLVTHAEVQGNATVSGQFEVGNLLDLILGRYVEKDGQVSIEPLPGVYTFKVSLVYETGLVQVGAIDPNSMNFSDYIGVKKFQFSILPNCYGFFGTDPYGRPLGLGLLMGVPVAFYLGLSVSLISTLIGALYGTLAGYWKDLRGEALMRIADIVVSLPFLPILIVIGAVLGSISINLLIFLMIILFWAGPVIVIRSAALQISEQLYIEAARASGVGTARIIFRHIFPQVLPYTLAIAVLSIPGIIITEAGLSLLGFGDPTLPTWGKLLEQAYSAQAVTNGLWWTYLFPGLALVWFSAAFLLIGRSLEPIVAPKLQK